MSQVLISVDRAKRSFAIFTGYFELKYGFEKYVDEDAAVRKARQIASSYSYEKPIILYHEDRIRRYSHYRPSFPQPLSFGV